MRVENRGGSLFVPALDLWLDPDRDVPRAFVSHAHGDHAAGWSSGTVFGSHEALALLQARRGPAPGALPIEWNEHVEMAIDRAHGGGTARVSIAPAGHVLGAAQLVIDHPRGRLVYTGDYRTGPGATHATGAPVPCDTLVIETTFGLPIFRFPPRDRVIAELVAWCRQTLEAGDTPVVLAYALGKSQSLVHAFLEAGLPVVAHGAVHRISTAYEALGVVQGIADARLEPYAGPAKPPIEKPRAKARGYSKRRIPGILLAPPTAAAHPMIKSRREARVAYVSGWALLDASLERHRADAAFVLSDHADFDDLAATVEATGARHVYATHGEAASFAAILNARGVRCEALQSRAIDEGEEATA